MRRPRRAISGLRAPRGLARTAGALGILAAALLLCPSALAAPPEEALPAGAERRDPGVWRGVVCTSPSCRPASRWDAAAFALAVVSVGWFARRRLAGTS